MVVYSSVNDFSTYLTPIQCAEQFDLYASAHREHIAPSTPYPYHEGKRDGYVHAARFLREFAQLHWSTILPTKPGCYWCRRPDGEKITIDIVWVEALGQLMLDLCEYEPLPPNHSWAGPIPEPID